MTAHAISKSDKAKLEDAAESAVDTVREKVNDRTGTVLNSLRDQSQELAEKSKETLSNLVTEGQERAAALRDTAVERGSEIAEDLREVASSGKDFASRNPVIAMAGAALAGYVIGRLLHRNNAASTQIAARGKALRHAAEEGSDRVSKAVSRAAKAAS